MGRGIFFSQRAVPPTLQKIDHSDFYFFITITSPIEEVDKDEIDDRRKEHRQGAIVQCSAKACSPGRLLFSVETSCTAQKYSIFWHCLNLFCSPAQGVCWRPVPLVDANFDEVSVWYVSHHVVPNQWVFNFRIFLFGELSLKKCSPVISVVTGSIDRPHLAANSKNNQEESQPCCHLNCGWSLVFSSDGCRHAELQWAQALQGNCFWLLTHFTQVGIGAMMLLLVSETGQMVRAQKPRVCTCKVDSE